MFKPFKMKYYGKCVFLIFPNAFLGHVRCPPSHLAVLYMLFKRLGLYGMKLNCAVFHDAAVVDLLL